MKFSFSTCAFSPCRSRWFDNPKMMANPLERRRLWLEVEQIVWADVSLEWDYCHTHVQTLLVALVNERRFFVWCAIPAWHGNVLQPDNLELWRLESAPFGEFVAFVLVVNIRILATLNSPKMIYRGGPLEINLDLLYKLHVASGHHLLLERLRPSSPFICIFYLAPETALFNEV